MITPSRLHLYVLMYILLSGFWSAGAQSLAFPGAEGFGKFTTGGRGGTVYHVTNLNDSGTGSFRDAVSQSNRTVVFDVGGIINISSRIVIHENVTVAGQTAPGDGITIYGNGIALNGDSGNDIIRYIRIRMGKNGDSGKDAVGISDGQNYIFDHVSISWGRDGTLDVNGANIDNLTFQDCIISQGINNSNHSTGGLMQSGKWSMIRSLYIDNKTRNPKARGSHEFINSVLYNWKEHGYIMGDTEGLSQCNLIGNYFIYGPSSASNTHLTGTTPAFHVYAQDNWVDSNKNGTVDGSLLTDYKTATVENSPYAYPGVHQVLSASQALDHVTENAGASLSRDAVDLFLINQLTSYGTIGQIINTEDDNGISGNVGTVNGGTPPADSDQDGMSDSWESNHGLNPHVADNNGDADGDGYTNLEEYLDWIINNDSGCTPTSIIPYIQVNGGSWQQVSSVTVSEGSSVKFGPNPTMGGSWSWSGCGTSGSAREQTVSVNSSCMATVLHTNTCGAQSTQDFYVNVSDGTIFDVAINENETGFCGLQGTIDSNHIGYEGAGFANSTNVVGAGIDWFIAVPSEGNYVFRWKYANGTSSARQANVIVDGAVLASTTFEPTGGWAMWSEDVSTTATLLAGTHSIRLEATSASGLANIDKITIQGVSPQAAACSSSLRASSGAISKPSSLEIYPSPTEGMLNIILPEAEMGVSEIVIYDLSGKLSKTIFTGSESHFVIAVDDLKPGIYVLKIEGSRHPIRTKFIKK